MRIIGGVAAGLLLKVPKGYDLRPTPDLVRQAIFNSLGAHVVGARVLDLFSGSGALGLECLSRGASLVTSVERSSRHAVMIRQNLEATRLAAEKYELRAQDVFTALAQLAHAQRQFDLILADPPYGEKNIGRRSTSLAQRLLDAPELPALLARDGLFVLGHTKRDTLSLPSNWEEKNILKHGDSWMRFLAKRTASDH
jgi:16S rRNA (guanine966-N2)-methyltransferase